MNKYQVKELALANGFKLKEQPDGTLDLNPYVYEFAAVLSAEAGRAGFVAGFKLGTQTPKPTPDNCASAVDFVAYQIEKFANIKAHEYADQIQQGGAA